MKNIFAFTLDTEIKFYDKGDVLFSDKGDTIGKILNCHKNEVMDDKVHYIYDVEATEEIYEMLKNEEIRIWKLDNYTVSTCSTWYYYDN
ncbi:MAG: hypothetical protein J6B96_06355 [Agathobacter sp.]|nr:hypothetical protein [Agathobacter sp.]